MNKHFWLAIRFWVWCPIQGIFLWKNEFLIVKLIFEFYWGKNHCFAVCPIIGFYKTYRLIIKAKTLAMVLVFTIWFNNSSNQNDFIYMSAYAICYMTGIIVNPCHCEQPVRLYIYKNCNLYHSTGASSHNPSRTVHAFFKWFGFFFFNILSWK